MNRYAVKIGEIIVRSDKPITQEERAKAKKRLEQAYGDTLLTTEDGLVIAIRPQP